MKSFLESSELTACSGERLATVAAQSFVILPQPMNPHLKGVVLWDPESFAAHVLPARAIRMSKMPEVAILDEAIGKPLRTRTTADLYQTATKLSHASFKAAG